MIGQNALLLAPNANVQFGGKAGTQFIADRFAGNIPGAEVALAASHIDIAAGALIDVSGVKDVELDASRHSLLIDPVKRNELRDTPNYRETNTNGQFTLNGAAVYVDPRITGVRDDGVAYVGSPLIEAGSAASQIGVTASELMTRGGSLSLNVATMVAPTPLTTAPKITIARDATIDFSGGWVRYLDGIVRTSRLLTADGRAIDIGLADPNDRYVAIGDGFSEVQAKFGISRTFSSSILQGERFEYGYDEGRDAGSLIVSAPYISLDATLHGDAFAGSRQLAGSHRPSVESLITGDPRLLQSSPAQLPAGGYLHVGAFRFGASAGLTGDILLDHGGTAVPEGTIHLDDTRLSAAGLSALSLRTTGGVNFNSGSALKLANGASLLIEAGRTINLDGTVSAPSGRINVRTVDYNNLPGRSDGNAGSPFRTDDDIREFSAGLADLNPFDINVSGTLSTAGLWVNDFSGDGNFVGSAWDNGGSISLTVAPNAFIAIAGSHSLPTGATDLSGSIHIAASGLLDVSSGGYVGPDGELDLSGRGGNVSLINETRYASVSLTDPSGENTSAAQSPLGGINQSVGFTPYTLGQALITPALVPSQASAEVSFDASSIKGFGFTGGGTFRLVAPDIAMGSQPGARGPRIGLDFFAKTGFRHA